MLRQLFCVIVFLTFTAFPQQAGKVYVLSEGGFSAGSARLGMLNNYNSNYTGSIFSPGSPGLYPDGLIYNNGFLYMAEQGSFGAAGKVYKLDTTGAVIASKIVGTNPYSLAVSNGKIFVTNGPAGNVSVLDESSFNTIATITVGVYPQEIIALAGKIFVANTSVFGGAEDNTVSVIDALTNVHLAKITVRKDPSSLAVTNDGYLLVACPGDGTTGVIYKIDPASNAKVDSFYSPSDGVSKDIAVDKNSNKIFYIGYSGNIAETDLSTRQSATVITGSPGVNFYYGYNYDYLAKRHYLLDAKSFTVSGSLNVHNSSGALLNSYQTGNAPRRVVFKYDPITTLVNEKFPAQSRLALTNYPNPFNRETVIRYQISGSREQSTEISVQVKLFDMLGREVVTLVNENKSAGIYEVTLSAAGLAAGIYLCELRAGKERINSKFIINN